MGLADCGTSPVRNCISCPVGTAGILGPATRKIRMSFIRLSREPGFHYLAAHTFFEQSPTYDHVLEAQCAIQSVTETGLSVSPLNVPLADFATYPIGSVFGHAKASIKPAAGRRRINRTILLNQGFESWQSDRCVEVRSLRPNGRWQMPVAQTLPVLINHDHRERRLGVAHGEQFRFICSSMSLLLDTISFLSLAFGDDLSGAFVDAGESGIDDDGTLVITPRRAFQNVTATLQIALLMTEPALARYLATLFADFRLRLAIGELAMPGTKPLVEPSECSIEVEPIEVVLENGNSEKVDYCDRIVADHRKPQFKDIVVRVRSSRADEQIEMIRALMTLEERERQRINSSTQVGRYPNSSTKPIRLARLAAEFGRLFPAFGPVKLRFDREYVRPNSPQTLQRIKWNEVAAPLATVTSDSGGSDKIPNVRSGPVETRVFKRPTVSERFLCFSDDPGLIPVIVQLEAMPPFMRAFLEAAYHLYDDIAQNLLPPIDLSRGEELLFELPESWGGLAQRNDEGLARYVAAFPLGFDHGIVWAIEILRRHRRDQFAIGLCAPFEHDDGLAMLGRIMRAISDRVGRRRDGDVPGTFPRADFADVRIDSILHNEARWDAETLSQVLLSRSQLLVSPQRRV